MLIRQKNVNILILFKKLLKNFFLNTESFPFYYCNIKLKSILKDGTHEFN